ncbi:MAG: 4-hydroxy-tetrahydrodipicolinate synthase [Candidatus Omnitrophica bacterium]|nr:4-hydroxy-tetrahydrodipicolinate synthase [Candidatus Omnitrophota bacterium]
MKKFTGSMVALVTPFKDNQIDKARLKELVEFHIKSGTDALVPCGTTGESATLAMEEHEKVIDLTIKFAGGRITVIAGTGSNNTAEAIQLTHHAKKSGADGVLLVSPYYNRPTQAGLYQHFKAVADEVDIPIILYNIASRTGVNIEPETLAKLSEIKNIIGVKEASGNLEQMSRVISMCRKDFIVLSGDDALTLPLLAIGGKGVISVVANIIPKDVANMVRAFEKGDLKKARELHYKMLPLIKAMFMETNPIPVKTSMALMGIIEHGLRLPMCDMSVANLEKLKQALKDYNLLK